MGFREMAGDMARTTSGVWRGIAEVVDPAIAGRAASTPATEDQDLRSAVDQVAEIDLDAETMLVPIDAWTRVLDQLGNLHEAGQQLADARERAAKAETENSFLREQLRDIKANGPSKARRPAAPRAEPATAGAADHVSEPAESRSLRARRQVSNWLSP